MFGHRDVRRRQIAMVLGVQRRHQWIGELRFIGAVQITHIRHRTGATLNDWTVDIFVQRRIVAGEINRRVDQQLGCDLCRRTAQRDG